MILYSIRDKVADEFGPIFQAKNDGVAKRMYSQTLQGDRVVYADDYSLWAVGEFDSETGLITVDKRLVYEPKSEIVKADESSAASESDHKSVFSLFRRRNAEGVKELGL